MLTNTSCEDQSKHNPRQEHISRSQELIFPFLCIWQSMRCAALRHKTSYFSMFTIMLPIWSASHIPPQVCVLHMYCRSRLHYVYHHPFPLLVIYWGRWSWNKVCLPISLVFFPLWHRNIPFMTTELTPHRPADFLCNCLMLRARKCQCKQCMSIHTLSVQMTFSS